MVVATLDSTDSYLGSKLSTNIKLIIYPINEVLLKNEGELSNRILINIK